VLAGGPRAAPREAPQAPAADAEAMRAFFPGTLDMPAVDFAPAAGGCAERQPLKVGVVLSGGQAPGGHNVVAGVFDGIRAWHEGSRLFGFLDGPRGIYAGDFVEVTPDIMDGFRNSGGFDMLGSGRHKIETQEHFRDSLAVCTALDLDGLVIVGGDDSNTNAAVLAEYFLEKGCKTKVVGTPKTIDGDLKCPPYIPLSFGFDTACKTYATLVANVSVDALSSQKYYHLVRLMGRSASNIALEVALQTRPNLCFIGEEVERRGRSLEDLTLELADMIEERSRLGKNYGVVVLPEGLVEFIPEFGQLIRAINEKLALPSVPPTEEGVLAALSPEERRTFAYLPDFIRAELLLDRDPHGNVQVAKIEMEKMLAADVAVELAERRRRGTYAGDFRPQFHAFGYEGRAGLPTVFDATYCYALGLTAAQLVASGCTGLLASVRNLLAPAAEWQCGGVPIAALCVVERRKGRARPVIRKALVDLEGAPFAAYAAMRAELRVGDFYTNPGPTQFDMWGCDFVRSLPLTLQLELGQELPPMARKPEPVRMGQFLYVPETLASRSEIQRWRAARRNRCPDAAGGFRLASVECRELGETMCFESERDVMQKYFSDVSAPLVEIRPGRRGAGPAKGPTVGVVFSGRQAPGCHDLVCGVVDMLRAAGSRVLGFVGGTKGFFERQAIELTPEVCEAYRGTGGLSLLGRTVDRLKSEEELAQARTCCEELGLSGLILVGGARTCTDAAYVAEYMAQQRCETAIVGVPCGIEGSMVNEFIETSIGFDSAAKAMAQLVGNTAIDGSSARKYYYFLKLMDGSSTGGRVPTSHIALEVALQTKPNMLLLTEEVDAHRMSLREVVCGIADVVVARARLGKHFGTIIVAEGLLAAIPEFRNLIGELEAVQMPCPVERVLPELTQWSRAFFMNLPSFIQQQLLLERQSNKALQLSQLETERLMAELVEHELSQRKAKGLYEGHFRTVCQFLGYQARCSVPTDFDSDFAYALGGAAAALAASGRNGYLAVVSDLSQPVERWRMGGVPFTAMMRVPPSLPNETFRPRPAIFPHHVDLEGAAFRSWEDARSRCALDELYENPGPIQLSGRCAAGVCATVATKFSYLRELNGLKEELAKVSARCRPGCDPRTVSVAALSLRTLNAILSELKGPGAETMDAKAMERPAAERPAAAGGA